VTTKTDAKKDAKPKSAKQVAIAYFEVIGNRDIDGMMKLWEPGCYGYIHGIADLRVPDGYREYFGGLFTAFPDFQMEITDLVAYGDKAAVRWTARGTFTGGKFEGLSPTGARIEMEGCDLLTIRDGLIRENRAYFNATEMARQLKAMPPAGSIGERAMLGAVNARTAAVQFVKQRRGRA
jgi:predicted ester cyclase